MPPVFDLDLSHARPYLDREPPDLGPIEGSGHLKDLDGSLGIEQFELRGGREGVFQIEQKLQRVGQLPLRIRVSL